MSEGWEGAGVEANDVFVVEEAKDVLKGSSVHAEGGCSESNVWRHGRLWRQSEYRLLPYLSRFLVHMLQYLKGNSNGEEEQRWIVKELFGAPGYSYITAMSSGIESLER